VRQSAKGGFIFIVKKSAGEWERLGLGPAFESSFIHSLKLSHLFWWTKYNIE